jgi:hypothetical protein
VHSSEATDAGKLTKIRGAMVIIWNTPQNPSLSISLNNSFSLQFNVKFTEYALFRKMVSSQSSFEI